ncbi:MAG: TetR/AcrR family transcriptional regulator [Desulfovibrio sp.]|nr:TetR/AcrR family transcriptional regulator [Desulfovibrio sp.]MBR4747101.1 TetR/AcrR family transcriptional regulator [Desulfovibrio sp.]MBR6467564.1 TetR/AcrR family transcriptional regulator [Desulfovibrio sp.]
MSSASPRHAPKGRPPASQSADRRERILLCAVRLFADQGESATTMAQIAEAAGVTPAMIHYYFKSRAGLLDAVAEECILPIAKSVWGAADAELADPAEAVCAWAGRMLDAAGRLPELPRLWAREFLAGSGALRDRVVPAMVPAASHRRLIDAIARAQQDGRMNPCIDPVLLMPTVVAMVMCPLAAQNVLQKVPTVGRVEREALARHVRAFLLAGLAPRQ